MGGSESLTELELADYLIDYLITSTNIITEGGKLMNQDSTGNRAAAIVFGPEKVIIIASVNKVVKNLEMGF